MNLFIKNIALNYSYKSVLKNVSLQFSKGQIHAVLGENGAGKSSLAKIICGEIVPDSGEIFCEKNENKLIKIFPDKNFCVKKEISNGICCVHQRPLLAENASIFENVILGLKTVNKKKIEQLIKIWLPEYSGKTLVKDIGSDSNFFTALICALLKEPEILILDEPCALLDNEQTVFLYKNLKKLAENGMNVIVITHSKKEAEVYCDTITILEDGIIVFDDDKKNEAWKTIFLNKSYDNSNNEKSAVCSSKRPDFFIEFSNINCKPVNKTAISNINFSASGGKITLISGLSEDGIETLEDVICGMETDKFSGKIKICKSDSKSFHFSLKNRRYDTNLLRNKTGFKVGIIPSDKTFRASNPDLTIKQILSFSPLSAKEIIKKAEINISENEKTFCLSGGMLQRLILQRELSYNPDLLIFCEPLQGLDYAAAEKICKTLGEQAELGKIVLILSSSEFPENMCQKIYKLKNGKLFSEGEN